MHQRLSSLAQPVLWTAGVALLIVVLAGLFRNIGQPGGEGATEETPTFEGTALPEATATLEACTAQANIDTPVYPEPVVSDSVLGIVAAGETVPVLGQHLPPEGGLWLLIQLQEPAGWISAQDVSVSGICPTPPPIPTLEVGPLPTKTLNASGTCEVGPTEWASDTHIYAGPGTMYSDFSKLAVGERVPATGTFTQSGYDVWWRVDYNGQEGWVTSVGFEAVGGACWTLPQVPVDPPPPTYTPSPTYPPSEPSPTNPYLTVYPPTPTNPYVMTLTPMQPIDIPPAEDIDFVVSVGPDLGSSASMTASLPDEQGQSFHIIDIRIDGLPPEKVRDNMRTVYFSLTCDSPSSPVNWGYYHGSEEAYMPCSAPSYDRWLDAESNSLYIVIGNADLTMSGSYTLTVSVGAYNGW